MTREEIQAAAQVMLDDTEYVRFQGQSDRSRHWRMVPRSEVIWDWHGCDYESVPDLRESWINVYPDRLICFSTNEEASALLQHSGRTIHVREVIEEQK